LATPILRQLLLKRYQKRLIKFFGSTTTTTTGTILIHLHNLLAQGQSKKWSEKDGKLTEL